MIRHLFQSLLSVALLLSLSSGPSRAQVALDPPDASPGTVSGMGTVTVRQKPTLLRMTVQLSEKAGTLKEALANLKDRREAALLQLEQMGAAEDAVQVTEPMFSSGLTDQQKQMQRRMLMQRARGGRVPRGLKVPPSVTVAVELTAAWPLDTTDHERLLAFCHDLQTKIAAADLAGLNEPKQLSPEEQELAEESQEASMYGSGDEDKPGEPKFVYVGKISEEERQQAMKQAFAKAKAQAERVATAAGAELGKLSSLSGTTNNTGVDNDYATMYRFMRQARMVSTADSENEAISPTPDAVNFQIVVHATFALK